MARRPRRSGPPRGKFDETKHKRGGPGNRGQFANQAGKGDDAPKTGRRLVGEERLKTSGVTGADTIVLRSTRLRSYAEGQTVKQFVDGHPKGRAYALRKLAADQKKGVIGFRGAETAPSQNAPILAQDLTDPKRLPKPGTPERAFHDDMLRAASVFGDRAKLTVSYSQDGKPQRFGIDVLNAARDEEIGFIERSFSTDRAGNRIVTHDTFMLDETIQGAGASKKFLAASVEAYKNLDIDRIQLHANIDVGGYAWLKYGFEPSRESYEDLTRYATRKADVLLSRNAISEAQHGHIERMLNLGDYRGAAEFGGAAKVEYGGKTQTIGKHLFLGSDWHGELDLRDRRAMQRFNDYTGGKN